MIRSIRHGFSVRLTTPYMLRRDALIVGTTVLVGAVAGCLGDDGRDNGDDADGDDDSDDAHLEQGDVTVPLVGVREAVDWHESGETVFLDARSREEYEDLHIANAEHSAAPDGLGEDDPAEDLDPDTRIVTYCVCPHTLAGQRAASLIENGFTDVHALDEGLQEWLDRGHPVDGASALTISSSEELPDPEYH